jgi:hypothetical protein
MAVIMSNCFGSNRLALLLVFVLCLPLTAHADEASRRAKAKQMLAALHVESQIQQASANMLQQISAVMEKDAGPNPTPESKAKLADAEKKISQLIDQQLGWKALEPTFIDLYAKTFTEQEMDQIIAFYKTPGGAALIQKMPAIEAQTDQDTRSKVDSIQPQINQLYNDFRSSLTALPVPTMTDPSSAGITLAPVAPAASTAK